MASRFRRYWKGDKICGKLIIIVNYTLTNLQLLDLLNVWKIH